MIYCFGYNIFILSKPFWKSLEECLDHTLIVNAEHLQRVLIEFAQYYNASRPHQGIDQHVPIPSNIPKNTGFIQRRKVLGGIIDDYFCSSDRYLPSTFWFYFRTVPPYPGHFFVLNDACSAKLYTSVQNNTPDLQYCELTFLLINGWKTRIPFPIFLGNYSWF